jgi:hypothetical protein
VESSSSSLLQMLLQQMPLHMLTQQLLQHCRRAAQALSPLAVHPAASAAALLVVQQLAAPAAGPLQPLPAPPAAAAAVRHRQRLY